VIPTYNSSRTIERAIKSALDQGGFIGELIVVDNGSTDETLAVVNAINDERLIILNEPMQGASFARNKGLEKASGKYIQFLDADDELMPGKLKHQLDLIEASDADILVASSKTRTNSGLDIDTIVDPVESPWVSLFKGKLGNTVSNLWNRDTLMGIGGWNTKMLSSQESELMFRMLKCDFQIQFDVKPLTLIHQDAENRISDINLLDNAIRYYKLRLEILDWLFNNRYNEWKSFRGEYAQSLFNALISVRNIQRTKAMELYRETNKVYWSGLNPKTFILKSVYFN